MKLSFVIPTYNCQTWLPHAVASCLQQTHKDFEVVVVDDGSTDRTRDYLDWLKKNEKIKIITNPVNFGRSASRNIGNQAAQGDLILVLDADDISTPNRAELMVKKFNNADVDYIYGSATVIDCIGRPQYILGADVFDKEKALERLDNRIVHSTVAYKREFADKFPYQSADMARLGIDDWSQQIKARIECAKFDFVPQKLACYRILRSQITQNRDVESVKKAKKAFLEGLKVTA